MSANVETMFYTRTKPWHGLGTRVEEAPTSEKALIVAGLDWNVIQRPVYTDNGIHLNGYKANVRDIDDKVLGVVTDRYKVVQIVEAFSFTDTLLGEGVRYETAGSLAEGKRTWLLAKLPQEYIITGERISPYLVFMNSHDGTAAIKAAITPIRVVCQNTLNLALSTAKRSWSTIHTGDINSKLEEAQQTLLFADRYMEQLGKEIEHLQHVKVKDDQLEQYMSMLFPVDESSTDTQKKNILRVKDDIRKRYYYAPDLKNLNKNAYRFINAISDFATHAKPLRETQNYQENMFAKTIEGNPLIDKAYQLIKQVA